MSTGRLPPFLLQARKLMFAARNLHLKIHEAEPCMVLQPTEQHRPSQEGLQTRLCRRIRYSIGTSCTTSHFSTGHALHSAVARSHLVIPSRPPSNKECRVYYTATAYTTAQAPSLPLP